MYRFAVPFVLVSMICLSIQGEPVAVQFYEDLSLLPYVYDQAESYYLSSYDRSGGNDDGFAGTYSQLYVDENGEHVIFDAEGPGCVYNMWFTGAGRELHWGKIRFYVDGEKDPVFESADKDLFLGGAPPFVEPLVTGSFVSSGGFSSSVPIPFEKHLKITTERTVGFYNIYYQLYKDVTLESWNPKQCESKLIDLFERCGSDPKDEEEPTTVVRTVVSPGKVTGSDSTEETLVSLETGGTIQFIKINPLFEPDSYSLNHFNLKVFYDGSDQPAVDVPIGPFFGSGLGEADVRSLFVGMSTSGAYYCFLPMPYREAIRITLQNGTNESGKQFYCEVGYTDKIADSLDGRLGYLGAEYNTAWPIAGASDYILFDCTGRGAVVGQVMTVEPVKPDRKRWWEGDMRISIDGEKTPRFHGTGHEDEYQGGWSTFWLRNPYSLPLFGQPKTENLIDVQGQANGSTTMYRFWPGKIHFRDSIRISTEHGHNNDTPANYSSLIYYYYIPE